MKTALMITLTLAISFMLGSSAVACDKTKTKEKKATSAAVDKSKKTQTVTAASEQKGETLLTGSRVKQNIKRYGQITDGPNPVIVLDRDTIERSGASDVKQLLNRQGVH